MFFSQPLRALRSIREVRGLPEGRGTLSIIFFEGMPFLAGAAISRALEYAFEWPKGETLSLHILLIVTCLLVTIMLYMIGRIVLLTQALQASTAHRVFVHRDIYVDGKVRRNAYSFCSAACLQAKRSIVVMGPHFRGIDDSQTSHDTYLEEGVESAVERHIRDDESDFRYERIAQLEPETFRKSHDNSSLDSGVFGNPGTARHVERMLKKARQSHNVEVSMYGRSFVPSFPSILVVDDRYVFFSLPTNLSAESHKGTHRDKKENIDNEDPLDDGKSMKLDMVLGIEDLTGEIPMLFRQVILHFKQGGFAIEKVL